MPHLDSEEFSYASSHAVDCTNPFGIESSEEKSIQEIRRIPMSSTPLKMKSNHKQQQQQQQYQYNQHWKNRSDESNKTSSSPLQDKKRIHELNFSDEDVVE